MMKSLYQNTTTIFNILSRLVMTFVQWARKEKEYFLMLIKTSKCALNLLPE